MHMAERNWNAAATDFFESFKNYDEAGQPRDVRSLKYLVLANMLMESNVNPFDAQEARRSARTPRWWPSPPWWLRTSATTSSASRSSSI